MGSVREAREEIFDNKYDVDADLVVPVLELVFDVVVVVRVVFVLGE